MDEAQLGSKHHPHHQTPREPSAFPLNSTTKVTPGGHFRCFPGPLMRYSHAGGGVTGTWALRFESIKKPQKHKRPLCAQFMAFLASLPAQLGKERCCRIFPLNKRSSLSTETHTHNEIRKPKQCFSGLAQWHSKLVLCLSQQHAIWEPGQVPTVPLLIQL